MKMTSVRSNRNLSCKQEKKLSGQPLQERRSHRNVIVLGITALAFARECHDSFKGRFGGFSSFVMPPCAKLVGEGSVGPCSI